MAAQDSAGRTHRLPPGQRAVDGFPRFGTHLHHPPPPIPPAPALEVRGAVTAHASVPLADLTALPRRSMTADLHCVAGWTAVDLSWAGVSFATFFRRYVEPVIPDGATITHFVFGGHDGYRVVVSLDDALADDVLIADQLNGHPLDGDHGAPVRLVSPQQYGFCSVKHLSLIEVHTAEPRENFGGASRLSEALMVRPLFSRHPRSRVWEQERNAILPAWVVLPLYRLLTPAIRFLCARGRSG